jgi:hypothetical protein
VPAWPIRVISVVHTEVVESKFDGRAAAESDSGGEKGSAMTGWKSGKLELSSLVVGTRSFGRGGRGGGGTYGSGGKVFTPISVRPEIGRYLGRSRSRSVTNVFQMIQMARTA